ncbi:tyrosine-protein phosphatase non-receptor type 22 [Spea bombifrons]|uniref:tyrosine-protein phosphatase non-receptor type 22 n=1 Tax=Spea bombifrons TaxID=233779 RepID=UPI00234B122F|nr:tyrosine-protein phosphatase non-receptor type 22 [Spea bombifrons]
MDQREVLMRYVKDFQKKKENSEEFTSDFTNLKKQSAKFKTNQSYTTKVAERPENFKKNRYKDILPFDHSRVKLSLITSDEDTDYINANFIKGVYGPRAYIATQGPLPGTLTDFWRMIWEYKVVVIVMACMEFEMGKKKCERYWVELGSEVLQCGPFAIQCSDEKKKTDYIIRTLVVTYGNEIRIVHQLHYKNWPDHDVPSSTEYILNLIKDISQLQQDDSPPICVHCSAGCGRTGVICAIDYVWRLLKDKIIPMNFSVYCIIQEMRTQRYSLVQTKEQYELVYHAVVQLFNKELERINAENCSPMSEVRQTHSSNSSPALPSVNLAHGYTDQSKVELSPQEEIFQNSAGFCPISCSPVVKLRNGIQTSFISKSGTCTTSTNQQSDPVRPFEDVPDALSSLKPCKQQDTQFGNVNSNDLLFKAHSGDTRSYSGHQPLIKTKSSPFELLKNRYVSDSAASDSHMFNNPRGHVRECLRCEITGSLGNISTVPSTHAYIRLTEDPYFSPSSSSSDPGSPKFANFYVVASYPDVAKLPTNTLNMELLPSGTAPVPHTNITSADKCRERVPLSLDDERPPPLPERTPESFIVANQCEPTQKPPKLDPLLFNGKIGTSLEWGGASICKPVESNLMTRSKSVKVRSFRLEELHHRSPSPPPLPERTEDSFIITSEIGDLQNNVPERHGPSRVMITEHREVVASSEPEAQMTRKKSLKILRNVTKNLCSSSKSSESSSSHNVLSFLHFGFGHRFAKPKGPRHLPTSWNL